MAAQPLRANVLSTLHEARAQTVVVKVVRAQSFFESITAEEVEFLRRDPQISVYLKTLARELEVLASAVGPELVSIEEVETAA